MTIAGAPWWAKFLLILVSQVGLMGAQVLAYLQGGGVIATIAIALLQAIQGGVGSHGPAVWSAAGGAVVKVGRAFRLGRGPDQRGFVDMRPLVWLAAIGIFACAGALGAALVALLRWVVGG